MSETSARCDHRAALPGDKHCPDCGADTSAHGAPPPPASPAPVTQSDTFAAEGQVRQNQTYIGNRLLFTRSGDVETSFANVVSGQLIWQHLKGVLITQVVLAVVSYVIGVVVILLAAVATGQGLLGLVNPSGAVAGLGVFLFVLYLVVAIALLIAAFSGWTQQAMSEWQLLLDRRALNQDSAYEAIAHALRQRRVPAAVGPTRILLDGPTQTYGSYLVVSSDPYFVYISVLPYGDGLYLGWSMWREQRVTRLYAEWFRQLRTRWAGGGTLLSYLLQAESARALRETVHNAVRDGVEAAISQEDVNRAAASWPAAPRTPNGPGGYPGSAPPYGRRG